MNKQVKFFNEPSIQYQATKPKSPFRVCLGGYSVYLSTEKDAKKVSKFLRKLIKRKH